MGEGRLKRAFREAQSHFNKIAALLLLTTIFVPSALASTYGSGNYGEGIYGGQAPDTTPPTVSISAPIGGATVAGSLSIAASAEDNNSVAGVQFKYDTTVIIGAEDTSAPYTAMLDTTAVSEGVHTLIAVARDLAGNYATSTPITITVHNTGPVRSGGSPTGTLPLGTTSVLLSLNTDIAATCKYAASSGVAYGSMSAFDTTGGTAHSTTVGSLADGSTDAYYIKCSDTLGNINNGDYAISFSIGSSGGSLQKVIITSGTTWSVPSDWNSSSSTIEAIGAGGNGATGGATAGSGSAGGGGGEYRKISNPTLTPGSTVSINIPSGGAGSGAPGAYVKNNSDTIIIEAKNGANGSGATGGAGGSGGTGAVNYAGGAGGSSVGWGGAGGGGSAGRIGAGKDGGANGNSSSTGSAGGGGSNGGLSTAGNATPNNGTFGGDGGNGTDGTGGGTHTVSGTVPGNPGANGGGGGGAIGSSAPNVSTSRSTGGAGGVDSTFDGTHGASGGGAGGAALSNPTNTVNAGSGAAGGTYGGGGGGGGSNAGSGTKGSGGTGGQGIIVATYTPIGAVQTPSIISFKSSTGLIAAGSGANATLSWTTANATTSVSIDQGIGTQSATSTGSVSVTPSVTTTYTLTATNSFGSATQSLTITVGSTTVPSNPRNLAATAALNAVSLNWDAPSSDGGSAITGYLIEYKVDASSVWLNQGTLDSTAASTTISGLTAGTPYDFRVSATNAIGTGAPAALVTATPTAPSVPIISAIATSSVSTSQATITWTTDVASNSLVNYGTTTSYGSVASSSVLTTSHVIALTGLASLTTYHFQVVSSNNGATATSSDATFTTASAGVPAASSVDISGTLALGEDNSVNGDYTFSDPNGKAEAGSTYQWYRADTPDGTFSPISGATNISYILRVSDAGKYLEFEVTPASVSGTGEPAFSDPSEQINGSDVPTASNVTISGTPTEGETLTGGYDYTQPDGIAEGDSTFRWLRSSAQDGTYTAIPGATESTYALTPDDVGMYLEFEVTPVASIPPTTGDPATSDPTDIIAASTLPVASSVAISGTASVGSTLTGSYVYSDANGDPEAISTFRWLRSSTLTGLLSVISGATDSTYVLQSGDIGKYVVFEVTPVSTTATGAPVQSVRTTQVQNSGPPSATSVSVTGSVTEGTALMGTYTYSEPGGFSEASSTYRWLRSGTSNGVFSAIAGATARSYTPSPSDVGQYLKFEVTPVASVPPTTGSAVQSSVTSAVAPSSIPVANNVAIVGSAVVGSTLGASYAYSDAGSHPESGTTFAWYSASSVSGTYAAIAGALSSSYTLTTTDAGQYLKVEVTPRSTVATGTSVMSAEVGPIAFPAPVISAVTSSALSTSATITWTTDIVSDSQVSYGTTSGVYTETTPTTDTSPKVTAHSVALSGLAPSTRYYYLVTSDSGAIATSSEHSFTTTDVPINDGGEIRPRTRPGSSTLSPGLVPGFPSVPVASLPSIARTVAPGTSGPDVFVLQAFLTSQGYLALGNQTGYFGPLTQHAVELFQAQHGIVSGGSPGTTGYGTVGPQTLAAINILIAGTGSPALPSQPSYVQGPGTSFSRDLTIGSLGEDVRQLQIFLNSHGSPVATAGPGAPGSESTYFGALTKAALAAFQRAQGIAPPQGYFGPLTRAHIQGQ